MSTIEHKSSAKATIRGIFSTCGSSGTIALLSEVVLESVPKRRGRPTRDEKVARLIAKSLEAVLPAIAEAEAAAKAAAVEADE